MRIGVFNHLDLGFGIFGNAKVLMVHGQDCRYPQSDHFNSFHAAHVDLR